MYVPDEAGPRLATISPTSIRLYLYFCQWRDHATGYSRKGFARAVEELGLSRASGYRAHKDLLEGDWIYETTDGRIGLRGGSFAPFDKTEEARRVWSTPQAELPGAGRLNFETDAETRLNSETVSLNSETNRLNFETDAYMDRARVFPSNSPSDFPSHTPPTPSLTPSRGAPPDGGGVCVSIAKSRYEFEDVRAWAEAQKAGGARIDPYAVARSRWLDGTADADVGKFLSERESVRAGHVPVEDKRTPFHVAAQAVNSVAQVPGYDIAGYIAQMRDVDEATRERLRETFLRKPSSGDVAARAHAPP
jgi:hypothetical protein